MAFELAAGSVIGRSHRLAGRNNQDAFVWSRTPEATVAVVADGCSSGRHSEVGARLGARLLAEALRRMASRLDVEAPALLLAEARDSVLASLLRMAETMGGNLPETVSDHFLFTLVGAVVADSRSFVFVLGDGVHAVNGNVRLVNVPDNAPPYLGYGLVGTPPDFDVVDVMPTRELDSLVLATDGAGDLVRACECPLPGRADVVGPLAQFWQDARYYANPYALTRRLTLLARDAVGADGLRAPGLLPDDTTLVVIRRAAA